MILVDSSAWIEFQRATGSQPDHRLTSALASGEKLATTGIVLMEVLAGCRDEAEGSALRRLLARCEFLPLWEPDDEESAAALYRACRRRGATVRRLPDCLIAAVAIRNDLPILHNDRDFDVIVEHSTLEVIEVT